MYYFDLLYPNEQLRIESRKSQRIDDSLIYDLQIREIIGKDIMDKKENEFLCNEIRYLPMEKDVIEHRQAILEDFIQNPRFQEDFMALCEKLEEKAPEKKVSLWEPPVPIYTNLVEYIKVLEHNYQVLCSTRLRVDRGLKSKLLKEILDFVESDLYKEKLKEIIEQLKSILRAKGMEFEVDYTYGQSLYQVRLKKLYNDNIYPMIEKKGLRKKEVLNEDYFIEASIDYITGNNVNEIYSKVLIHYGDFAMKLNRNIAIPFKRMYKDMTYYKIGIRLKELYHKFSIDITKPQISEMKEGVLQFSNLYSLPLLVKLHKQGTMEDITKIQTNSYSSERGRIAIITGVNSGGKTIFLQSLGIAQILMQLGFDVPATSFESGIVSFIGSLYARSEDVNTIHGKLEEELVAIENLGHKLKPNSLILINEILATTSEEEGSEIMADVLRAFSHTKSHMIVVTHLLPLAQMVENECLKLADGERAVNYTTEHTLLKEGKFLRTYRIVEGKPEKNIWEQELIDRYFKRVNGN